MNYSEQVEEGCHCLNHSSSNRKERTSDEELDVDSDLTQFIRMMNYQRRTYESEEANEL